MKLLVVVDFQKDFITGSLGSKEAQAIVPNVLNKIAEYEKNGDKVLFTRDAHKEDYLNTLEGKHLPVKHCIVDTDGIEIEENAKKIIEKNHYQVLDKPAFGSFEIALWIKACCKENNISEIEIIGLCTDVCVATIVLMTKVAMYNSAEIYVDSSCCAGITPEKHLCALETMRSCLINVK